MDRGRHYFTARGLFVVFVIFSFYFKQKETKRGRVIPRERTGGQTNVTNESAKRRGQMKAGPGTAFFLFRKNVVLFRFRFHSHLIRFFRILPGFTGFIEPNARLMSFKMKKKIYRIMLREK